MNAKEAAELLAHCSGFDNRQPSVAAAVAWASALHDIPLDADTKAAVAAYYTTPPKDPDAKLWILPHHVRTLRTKIRNGRLENFQYEPIPGETTAEYLVRLRGQVQAIASGRVAPPTGRLVLEGAPSRKFMAELEARGWEGNRIVGDTAEEALADTIRRSGPLGIPCPACGAAIGRPCKTPGATDKQPLGKPRQKPHSARLRAANGQPNQTRDERAAQEQRIREMSARHLARHDDDIPDAEIITEETA
ncbi:hypothetical protein DV517_61790 [Streptomyces sp. S816]|uniref:zinc finger domain-containing protein n=1 Tax=Streptomyces sp. S816 TaxID=2283197 RepID=UPI00109D4778|nr:hypothetical protein [Streptomyces sp. S816]TGZ14696.1 hypothetical protein DV517_61790 [Streptomyces sp. S816]